MINNNFKIGDLVSIKYNTVDLIYVGIIIELPNRYNKQFIIFVPFHENQYFFKDEITILKTGK